MTIRNARASDLDFYLECVRNEGWLSETSTVFQNLYMYDPNGCFVAEDHGERIGMIVATAYDTCGFIGELIVIKECRGRGVGRRLMEQAIGYLKARGCRSVYLDGDLPAVPLYERLGFRTVTRSLRFLGKLPGVPVVSTRPMTGADLPAVIETDRAAFGADRSFFLRRRLELFPQYCFVLSRGGADGFIMGQPGHDLITVGPWLTANELTDPLDLLRTLAHACGDQRMRIGILESNAQVAALMRSLDTFTETESSFRMVLGPDIGLGAAPQLLAIGSPAKG